MNDIVLMALVLIGFKMMAEVWLSCLNRKEVIANREQVPEEFDNFIDAETYKKSVDYTLDKNGFSIFSSVFEALVLVVILTSGVLPWMFDWLSDLMGTGLWSQGAVLISMMILLGLPHIPEELYMQFVIEERHGFNKSGLGLWITDKLKGIALGFALGVPVIWGLLKCFEKLGSTWWIWGFGLVFGFQLVMMLLYPKLILPLFNKLTPLEDGELKTRLMKLADKTGFAAETIEVMDGSKRSGHSNAFFTGMGKFRHIVLFDTLIEQLSTEELEAVLAHEIGHYKRGHIPKMLAIGSVMTLGFFWVIDWLIRSDVFLESFGFNQGGSIIPALILFSLLSGLVTFWFGPIMTAMSRKHEYEADAFAKNAVESAEPMISSLRKLSEKNLSNLTPHKLFSSFYYSHPTLLERERALRQG